MPSEKNGIKWEKFPSGQTKLIRYYLPTCFSTQDDFGMQKNLVNKHKQVGLGQTPPPPPPLVWEKFPLNPVYFSSTHLVMFVYQVCDIFRKKRDFVEKIPKLGEGGGGVCPLGNFSHLIPFFSEGVPKCDFGYRLIYKNCNVMFKNLAFFK